MNLRVALLFAYNGSQSDGLERNKGTNTIEGILLSHFASLASTTPEPISLINISRSSATEKEEHASRQIISCEMVGDFTLPSVSQLNDKLPDFITVFDILKIDAEFSARRTCDARTYEYLVPTYAFAQPSAATYYSYPEKADADEDPLPAMEMPRGGLFKTLKRRQRAPADNRISMDGVTPVGPSSTPEIVIPSSEKLNPYSAPPAAEPGLSKQDMADARQAQKEYAERRNVFGRVLKEFIDTLFGRKKAAGSDRLKASLNATLRRTTPRPHMDQPGSPTTTAPSNSTGDSLKVPTSPNPYPTTMGREETFVETLKRSMSRKKRPDVIQQDILESEQQQTSDGPLYYDPIDIPPPNHEQQASIRGYRMPERQWKQLNHVIALFNGTHNFHNYIPGAAQDDPRCYLRILNIEAAKIEMHHGVEWVRIKVQAKAFARYQIRRMMAMIVMVIRTNTPRSVVGNSFGLARLEIPEAPGFALILDEPFYTDYNTKALEQKSQPVSFSPHQVSVEDFRAAMIHDYIYKTERDQMIFEGWLRQLDSYSFLYTYFLNQDGLIKKPMNFLRPAEVAPAAEEASAGPV